MPKSPVCTCEKFVQDKLEKISHLLHLDGRMLCEYAGSEKSKILY